MANINAVDFRYYVGREASPQEKKERLPLSVLLKLPKFSKNYAEQDFVKALDGFVDSSEIRVLGKQKYPNHWTMTLSCQDARERVLQLGHFIVNGKKCVVHPQDSNEIRGRIHWLPGELADDKIITILERFGEVLSFKKEMVFRTPAELRSSVRSFSLLIKADCKLDDIPHFISVNNFEGLVTIKNRDPICLGCRQHGHRKSVCPNNANKKFLSEKKNKKKTTSTADQNAKETGTKEKKKKQKKKTTPVAAAEAAAPAQATTASAQVPAAVTAVPAPPADLVPSSSSVADLEKSIHTFFMQMTEALGKLKASPSVVSTADDSTVIKNNIKNEPVNVAAASSSPSQAGPSKSLQLVVKKEPVENAVEASKTVPSTQGAVGGNATKTNVKHTAGERKKNKKKKDKKVRFSLCEATL